THAGSNRPARGHGRPNDRRHGSARSDETDAYGPLVSVAGLESGHGALQGFVGPRDGRRRPGRTPRGRFLFRMRVRDSLTRPPEPVPVWNLFSYCPILTIDLIGRPKPRLLPAHGRFSLLAR